MGWTTCPSTSSSPKTHMSSSPSDRYVPGIKVRVVNVVDLTALMMPDDHPHGMDNMSFNELFTKDAHVIFAFRSVCSWHQGASCQCGGLDRSDDAGRSSAWDGQHVLQRALHQRRTCHLRLPQQSLAHSHDGSWALE